LARPFFVASCDTGNSPQGNISEERLGGKKKGRELAHPALQIESVKLA
jgi:hypothetical protein